VAEIPFFPVSSNGYNSVKPWDEITMDPSNPIQLSEGGPFGKTISARQWVLEGSLILFAGIASALAHGLQFMVGNQLTYFLFPLRLADPSFIPKDWWTWQVAQPHFVFGYVLAFLQRLGPLKFVTHLVYSVTWIGVAAGLYLIACRFCRYPRLVLISTLLWLNLSCEYHSALGGLYILSEYLQPSHVAGAGMILGFGLFFWERYILAGVVFGIAGIFHAGLLAAFGPLLFAQFLVQEGVRLKSKTFWFNVLRFWIPLSLFWIPMAWVILTGGQMPGEEHEIITRFAAPFHFEPLNWRPVGFFLWSTWAIASAGILIGNWRDHSRRPVFWGFWITLALTFGATTLAILHLSAGLTLMSLWRVAPWAIYLGVVALMDAMWNGCLSENLSRRKIAVIMPLAIFLWITVIYPFLWISPDWKKEMGTSLFLLLPILVPSVFALVPFLRRWVPFVFFGTMLIMLANYFFYYNPGPLKWIKWGGIAIPVLSFHLMRVIRSESRVRDIALLSSLLLLAANGYYGWTRYAKDCSFSPDPDTAAMEAWAFSETSSDAVFLTPPSEIGSAFRIRARRAIVVDFKAGGLDEWYRRIRMVSNLPLTDSYPKLSIEYFQRGRELDRGFAQLSEEKVRELSHEFGAQFLLRDLNVPGTDLGGLERVYSNKRFVVYRIP